MAEKMQASVPLGITAVMPLFGEVNLFPTERSNIVRLRNRRFAQKLTSPDISFSADTTPEISPREASLMSLLSATPSPHPENNTAANNMPANKVLLFILISPVSAQKVKKRTNSPYGNSCALGKEVKLPVHNIKIYTNNTPENKTSLSDICRIEWVHKCLLSMYVHVDSL